MKPRRPLDCRLWPVLSLAVSAWAVSAGCGSTSSVHPPTASDPKEAYAKAWSNRPDAAFDFRLAKRPAARYLLVPPAGYDPKKKYELWVAIFGTPSTSEQALAEWWHYARHRGAFLLAPHGSTRRRAGSSFAVWDFNRDPEEIAMMIDEVAERYSIDRKKLAIMGSSNGGVLALRTVSRYPDLFRFAAVNSASWKGVEAVIDRKGFWQAGRSITLFLGWGKDDPAYSQQESDTAVKRLRLDGFRYHAEVLEGFGHDPRPFLDLADRYYAERRVQWGELDPRSSVPLSGPWSARWVKPLKPLPRLPSGTAPEHNDPGISPEAEALVARDVDTSAWQSAPVPKDWDFWPGDRRKWDGEAVLRKEVNLPSDWEGHDLTLRLGYVDDTDDTFFNGERVGATTVDTPFWGYAPRIYRIPGRLVRAGRNVVAVRVFDRRLGGGIFGVTPGGILLER